MGQLSPYHTRAISVFMDMTDPIQFWGANMIMDIPFNFAAKQSNYVGPPH